jgi:hypothetical protein
MEDIDAEGDADPNVTLVDQVCRLLFLFIQSLILSLGCRDGAYSCSDRQIQS